MLKSLVLATLAASFVASAQGLSCDVLRTEIEAKFRTGGIANPNLAVVDAAAAAAGARVVGTCEHGSKKIVYTASADREATSPASTTPGANPSVQRKSEPILTECKDGTVTMGGTCGRK